MNRLVGALIGVVLAAVLFRASTYVVDQKQHAIVFQFGEIVRVVSDPGLRFKLPLVQNVVYVERRIQTIDTPQADRVQTSEKKNLLVDSFVKWRVVDPRRYFVSFAGSSRGAEDRINSLVRDALNQAVNRRTVNDITAKERERAMDEIRVAVQERVKDVGVEIVDVRLKRIEFVPEINNDVFRRMQSERQRVATEQRSIGAAEGEKIRADADRQREVLLAEAYSEAQKIKGVGEAKASAIYAEAFGQNPEFFRFYRSLEAYRTSFRSRSDFVVVDPSSEFFRYLKDPAPGPARPAR
jgi:modulator of FtsH protease HflC